MDEQMEYVFFSEALADKFVAYCSGFGVGFEVISEELHPGELSFTVQMKGQLDDETIEKIEDYYNDLFFGEQAAQIEGNDENGALADACGVQVQLQSGEFTTVAIHPEIMNKILSVLTVDELQSFLSQVAEDIENPKSGPICRREDLPSL
ncbi:hypothetical protein QCB44_09205 [Thiomicrorhabdus sp. zzn3]|uniref:hypothetical protein n=1 Tax=Thiomicrorhabdus sp. zzn3 TaxID=3039775 RepID=UPI002436AF73|nr:hypothetical protein [Thiomicrorhabdus sp. zzn3]MDG6778883.1 hypothetical protein [Thiomicrorhabdus sp. zzn3]